MTARDHLATARRQLDGADRRLTDGRAKEADGCLAGMIAEASKARLQIAYDRGREDERADCETQANLDRHVRVMRGRDAVAAVLIERGLRPDEARSRAGNIAVVLSNLEHGGDPIDAVRLSLRGAFGTSLDFSSIAATRSATTEIFAAWIRTEHAPDAPEAASPDELVDADVDAEGPCRAGDEERCAPEPKTAPPLAAE